MSQYARLAAIAAAIVASLMWLAPAHARQDSPGERSVDPEFVTLLEQIDARAATVETFQANFKQRKQTPLLKKPLVSTGRVRARERRMLWTTLAPRRSEMLVTSAEVQIYYPEDRLLEIYAIDDQLRHIAAQPVPRLETLRENFSLARASIESASEDSGGDNLEDELRAKVESGEITLVLMTPIRATLAKHVREVIAFLDTRGGYARRLEMVTPDGERTAISFGDVQINEPISDDQLSIDVPADVKVSRPLEPDRPQGAKRPNG